MSKVTEIKKSSVNKLTQIQAIVLVIGESKRIGLNLDQIQDEIYKRFPNYIELKKQYHENKVTDKSSDKQLKNSDTQIKDEIRRAITINSGLFINDKNGSFSLSSKGEKGLLKIQKLLENNPSLSPCLSRKQGIVMSTYKHRVFSDSGFYYGKTHKNRVLATPILDTPTPTPTPIHVSVTSVLPTKKRRGRPRINKIIDKLNDDVTPILDDKNKIVDKLNDDVTIIDDKDKLVIAATSNKSNDKNTQSNPNGISDDIMVADFLKRLPSLLDIDEFIRLKSMVVLNNLKTAILKKYDSEIDVQIDEEKDGNKLKQTLKLNFKIFNTDWIDYIILERNITQLFPVDVYAYNDMKFIYTANNDEDLFVIISCLLEDDKTKTFIYNLK